MNTPAAKITLHLVLTHHWYDETTKAVDPKRIEYRAITPRWMKLIYDRRDRIGFVRFARGYTSTTAEFAVTHIDIGPCLLPGHEGQRIRIHFGLPKLHWLGSGCYCDNVRLPEDTACPVCDVSPRPEIRINAQGCKFIMP